MKSIVDHWYAKHPFLYLLLPIAYLYRLGFFCHKLLYKCGLRKRYVATVPVIVVGNITVGGTGKTPFTIELARLLLAQGYKPGVISRGYKGKGKNHAQMVTNRSDPALVGDEPVLLATYSSCPVVVSPKRSAAIKLLLKNNHCDVILSDDGLQHHALKKDLEIALIDGTRRFGNGFCLPAGPLREPISKLKHVDFIVFNGSSSKQGYEMQLRAGQIYNLLNPDIKMVVENVKQPIHAIAAIGHPRRFFNLLREHGFEVKEYAFGDHHRFTKEDLSFPPNAVIIMTEKDAVKCKEFAEPNFWVLPVIAQFNDKLQRDLVQQVQRLLTKNL